MLLSYSNNRWVIFLANQIFKRFCPAKVVNVNLVLNLFTKNESQWDEIGIENLPQYSSKEK